MKSTGEWLNRGWFVDISYGSAVCNARYTASPISKESTQIWWNSSSVMFEAPSLNHHRTLINQLTIGLLSALFIFENGNQFPTN